MTSSSSGRLFAFVALFVAAVNIFTSLIVHFPPTNDADQRSSRLQEEQWTNNNMTTNHTTIINNNTRSIRNFLDCNRDDSPCRYFYPTLFYDDPSSFGYSHRDAAHQQLYTNPNRTLHANWARFISPKLDWTYVHIRKAGGNTMYDLAKQLQEKSNVKVEIMPSVPVHRLVKEIGEDAFITRMKKMVQETTFFTFVRDPISRFVSAMGQVKKKKRHVLQAVDCLFPNDDAKREIKCVLDLLKNGETVNDHFTPASIELYQCMFGERDKPVAVFPLERMNDFMKLWDIEPFRSNEAEGIKTQYSTDVLDANMIHDICQVYEADVYMMRSLGMSVEQCDAYLPLTAASQTQT